MISCNFEATLLTCSDCPDSFICDPLESILSRGNCFFKISNFELLMPKNSSGLICSTFKITSVKIDRFYR